MIWFFAVYMIIAFVIYGIGSTITPKMPWLVIVPASLLWPATIAIGFGVSVGKANKDAL
jgi:hypothetical protein